MDHRMRNRPRRRCRGHCARDRASPAAPARAEPYLMVRAGAKCNDCHTNLTGGGKRTPFAHIHARDILHDLDLLPIPPTA